MSFFLLTLPHPSVSPIYFSLIHPAIFQSAWSRLSFHPLSVSACLLFVCLCNLLLFDFWLVLILLISHTHKRICINPFTFLSTSHLFSCYPPFNPRARTHTRRRQMAHLPFKLQISVPTPPMSTRLAWVARTRPPTLPTPLAPPPPTTSPQLAAIFPAPWLCSTLTNPATPLRSPPKWEWPPSPHHLLHRGYTYNRF